MMRGSSRAPKARNTPSVCLSCAFRLHRLESFHALRLYIPRRFLQSSHPISKPASSTAASTAPGKQFAEESGFELKWNGSSTGGVETVKPVRDPPRDPPRAARIFGEAWAQRDLPGVLSPEELEQRNALRMNEMRRKEVMEQKETGSITANTFRIRKTDPYSEDSHGKHEERTGLIGRSRGIARQAGINSGGFRFLPRQGTIKGINDSTTEERLPKDGLRNAYSEAYGPAKSVQDYERRSLIRKLPIHTPERHAYNRIKDTKDASYSGPIHQFPVRRSMGLPKTEGLSETKHRNEVDGVKDDEGGNHLNWKHIRPVVGLRSGSDPSPIFDSRAENSSSWQQENERRPFLERSNKYSNTKFSGFDEMLREGSDDQITSMHQDHQIKQITHPPNGQQSRTAPEVKEVSRATIKDYRSDQIIYDEGLSRRQGRRKAEKAHRQSSRFQDTAEDDIDDSVASRIEQKRARKKDRLARKTQAVPTSILLPEFISIANLANALRLRAEDFSTKLYDLGFESMKNDHIIDAETAGLIASEFNFEPILPRTYVEEDLVALPPPKDKSLLVPRPPVITIMGHVDHGKTTLLDWLRKSSVAANEQGGITQHIGAFTVPMPSGRVITFLDTPGHAAFLSMRERGANVTDIVILVVAADDSVKPQTIEAIKHARAARVPLIVAINKIDKEDAKPEHVKQDLARHGVEVEDFGGETQTVCVSGKTGQGMEALEDAAIALADVLDVRAPDAGPVEGWVLEATAKKAGKVATVLIRRGTLTAGTILVAGTTWTRVRTLKNEGGIPVAAAGPGVPIEIDGWREQPAAGDEVLQASDEQRARKAIDFRLERMESKRLVGDVAAVNEARSLEAARDIESRDDTETTAITTNRGPTELPIIVRGDVSGSVEAVSASILGLGNGEVQPMILRAVVGPLTRSDIDYAATARGIIVCFNLHQDGDLLSIAEKSGVPIVEGSIIYRVVDEVKCKLEELLPENVEQRVLGEAEILTPFEIGVGGSRKVKIAGSKVKNGVITKGGRVRILRGGEVIYDGAISSLKSHKKDVTEIRKGSECGIGFEEFTEFDTGDQVQYYEEVRSKRRL